MRFPGHQAGGRLLGWGAIRASVSDEEVQTRAKIETPLPARPPETRGAGQQWWTRRLVEGFPMTCRLSKPEVAPTQPGAPLRASGEELRRKGGGAF